MPYDIFKNESGVTPDERLNPVGKMKGEFNGDFEAFYVAVDSKGSIYINRDMDYTEDAYNKSSKWEQITLAKLMEYEKQLHFMPFNQMKMKR